MKVKRSLLALAVSAIFFLSAYMMTGNAVSKCSNSITKGKTLYEANCLSCHGNRGKIHHIRRESRRSFIKDVLGSRNSSKRETHDSEIDNENDSKNEVENDNDGKNDSKNEVENGKNNHDNNQNDKGFDNNSKKASNSSSMPSFRGTLSKSKINRIYHYLKKPKKACSD